MLYVQRILLLENESVNEDFTEHDVISNNDDKYNKKD